MDEEPKHIVLKVPKGEFCNGCMFLQAVAFGASPACMLFNERLEALWKYGSVSEVKKCPVCPREG